MIKDTEFVLKLLREYGMADAAQILAARNAALESGSDDAVDELIKAGIIAPDELLNMLAQQYGMEVVDLKGHTAGSIGLLDRTARILYTGDGLNTHLWMQLDHSLPISTMLETFRKLKTEHGQDFDHVAHGHAKELRNKEILDWMIRGCEDILAGRTEQDMDYQYFGGVCRQHPISGTPGEVIVYNEGQ